MLVEILQNNESESERGAGRVLLPQSQISPIFRVRSAAGASRGPALVFWEYKERSLRRQQSERFCALRSALSPQRACANKRNVCLWLRQQQLLLLPRPLSLRP